ncbi:MAG: DinB family protein [bacterium]
MTTREMILRSHAIVHGLEVGEAEGRFSLEYSRLNGLTDDQLRLRPQGWNSIAYLLWHMARCEDVAVNVIVAQQPQLFDEGEWAGRLRISRRDVGTGMTDEEVEELSRTIDLSSLRAYRAEVGGCTQEVARALPDAEWDRVVDASIVSEAAAQGAFTPESDWVARFWEGKSKGWFLYWLAVGHNYMHMGHAGWVKEMVLSKRGR